MAAFFAGLDLAQASDYTSLVIAEHITRHAGFTQMPATDAEGFMSGWRTAERLDHEFHVRLIERVRGLSYVEVVERVVTMLSRAPLRDQVALLFDRTGVGNVVKDLLAEAYSAGRLSWQPLGITITSGEKEDFRNPPKFALIQNAVVLLESPCTVEPRLHLASDQVEQPPHEVQNPGRLKIAEDLPLAPVLKEELTRFQRRYSSTGHAKLEAAGSGHDDLVLGLALAVWPYRAISFYASRMNPSHIDAEGRLWTR